MIYKYGYRLRPPAIETEPRGYVSKKAFSTKEDGYHGVVTYDRELSVGEMYAYDLDYLGVVGNKIKLLKLYDRVIEYRTRR